MATAWSKVLLSKTTVLLLVCGSVNALDLDVNSQDSIRSAASTVAYGLQSYYRNNASNTDPRDVGTLNLPYYWWESGAMWGSLVDYWAYTGDDRYVENTINAFVTQSGPNRDLMNEKFYGQTGNDDQGFWALSLMSAVENGFPSPSSDQPQYLQVATNAFQTQVGRWDTAGCDGGLRWQIFDSHPGYPYMNTVSNGAFFQLAARLARATKNDTFVEWAEKAWDWVSEKGLIDSTYCTVYDGTNSNNGCSSHDLHQYTYNNGLFMYGAAALYDHTKDTKWSDRAHCLIDAAGVFFTPFDNATDVLYEASCETIGTCNLDMQSFKAYLARWMAKTTVLMPETRDGIFTKLKASASAAARSCSGGNDGVTCGTKWYVGGYDGQYGVGQQITALEVIQSLLVDNAGTPQTSSAPSMTPQVPDEPSMGRGNLKDN
ncbi:mannan endo-1,6-alpha-mannosidase-like protein DCW1 precursor [Pseudovirgaria hyperparasitica]|uniref:Mannan endo-1,6-alpha-mannosidase n=1 Tax=Pseudovirgaria hyperparasitica TaxID=470096 RepID=A0A6A6VUS6_9PEZI|nr:mannan endo-1,6-alpha-mannosidase-like protein DCW1 precursor [Pseudovirgaria hyperparasitica]KAF2753011.1 mannan endo-1,6-alpha-mannosidase-like protein DCW1 precursor [Pseudovirgaria hyperparasitica]